MEHQEETPNPRNDEEKKADGGEAEKEEQQQEEHVLQFMDSLDSYLTLMDSLSSALRQGWLQLAAARHSMGTSRITSALFDLKTHAAATTLQISEFNLNFKVKHPFFRLCKWSPSNDGKHCSEETRTDEEELRANTNSSQLRHRGKSEYSVLQNECPKSGNSPLIRTVDTVHRERSKSLSVFGTLVSPKLRDAQISFENAMETIVEIANMQSSMLSSFNQIQREIEEK